MPDVAPPHARVTMDRKSLPAERATRSAPGSSVFEEAPQAWPATAPSPPAMDLWWFLGVLRRHWRLVLLVTAGVTLLAAVVAYRATPRYTAWALVRLQDARAPLVHGLVDPMEAGPRTLTDPILSEIQVLTSRSVASQVVEHPEALPLRLRPVGFPLDIIEDVRLAESSTVDTLRLQFGEGQVTVSGQAGERRVSFGTPV